MTESDKSDKTNKYVAFISYSRKDKAIADWLHEKLESYALPDRQKALSIWNYSWHIRNLNISKQNQGASKSISRC